MICRGAQHAANADTNATSAAIGRLLAPRALAAAEEELQYGHNDGEQQTANEYVVNASDIAQRQLVGRGGLLAVHAGIAFGLVEPPFVAQLEQFAVLLKREHGQVEAVAEGEKGMKVAGER